MYDAVLEVNHWCHEKVIYTPTDIRTSAPMATVKTAYGRCGEESTFLVVLSVPWYPCPSGVHPALGTYRRQPCLGRSLGGRQMGTSLVPETEPVLNLGWFNAPASRGMLMHTKVFGAYDGPEEVMKTTANYTKSTSSTTTDRVPRHCRGGGRSVGKAVEGAHVEFKIYNYAEFFTVANKTTDAQGKSITFCRIGRHGSLRFGK